MTASNGRVCRVCREHRTLTLSALPPRRVAPAGLSETRSPRRSPSRCAKFKSLTPDSFHRAHRVIRVTLSVGVSPAAVRTNWLMPLECSCDLECGCAEPGLCLRRSGSYPFGQSVSQLAGWAEQCRRYLCSVVGRLVRISRASAKLDERRVCEVVPRTNCGRREPLAKKTSCERALIQANDLFLLAIFRASLK